MFIDTPKIIDSYVKDIPKGTPVDLKVMRKDLATEYYAENSYPVTTSIFLRILSEVAIEYLAQGKTINDVTPFWRAVHPKTPLAKKLSCGVEFIIEQRRKGNVNG